MILSIILGLLGLNGIGHLYVGKILLGILLLVGSIVVYYVVIIPFLFATILSFNFSAAAAGIIVALVAYIALFGWQIIHSRKLCQEYNAFYQANGRAPW